MVGEAVADYNASGGVGAPRSGIHREFGQWPAGSCTRPRDATSCLAIVSRDPVLLDIQTALVRLGPAILGMRAAANS